MKVNIKKLKQSLSLDDIECLIEALNIPITGKSDTIWHLKSGCHSKDCDCDSNLKFYTDSMTFTCFSHNCLNGNDIIDLITIRQEMFYDDWTFIDSVNFIIDTLNLDVKHLIAREKKQGFNYTSFFNKYLLHQIDYIENEIYDDCILNYFNNGTFHSNFFNEGISVESMIKYEIGFYTYKQQITIPVRDIDGNLIGIRVRNINPDLVDKQKYLPLHLDDKYYKFPSSSTLYGICQNKVNITKTKTAILFEGEKSVLKMENHFQINNSVALFGTHFGVYQRQLLIDLGVENVYIALDKQYQELYDEEHETYIKTVNKIVKVLTGWFNVYIIYDDKGLLDYKDSPIDKGKEIWDMLFSEAIKL